MTCKYFLESEKFYIKEKYIFITKSHFYDIMNLKTLSKYG